MFVTAFWRGYRVNGSQAVATRDAKLNDKPAGAAPEGGFELVTIRLPVVATFVALIAGLGLGVILTDAGLPERLLQTLSLVGTLWLRALQMTIIPLVAALLVLGLAQMVQAARAGEAARRFLGLVFGVLILGGMFTAIVLPLLLTIIPIPESASGFLAQVPGDKLAVPDILDFLGSLIAPNIIAAASETAMLPLTIFFAL